MLTNGSGREWRAGVARAGGGTDLGLARIFCRPGDGRYDSSDLSWQRAVLFNQEFLEILCEKLFGKTLYYKITTT